MTTTAYLTATESVLSELESTPTGLTEEQVLAHRAASGDNVIVTVARVSWVRRYLRQYLDWMIALLLASAVITGALGDLGTAGVLVVLVIINTLIGFVQEFRAEKTMEALEKLVDPVCEAYRHGALTELDSRQLVVGDLVRLSEGASVPADVRLTEVSSFSTNDFALTGESDPTRKYIHPIEHEVPVADRRNMAFAGTTVATGEAYGVVAAVGTATELGRIARLSQSAPQTASPLQREMATIAKYVTYGVAALSLIVLIIAVQSDLPIKEALLFAVGFACALIPQGLPAEVNTALASAAGVLARNRALVKRLSSVETLGATHVICTDKTGTLTRNQMTVTEFDVAGVEYVIGGTGYEPVGSIIPTPRTMDAAARVRTFLTAGVLCSNARLLPPDSDHPEWRILGDPTEGALLVVAAKYGIDLAAVQVERPEAGELPFDSTRKLMTSIRGNADGTLTVYTKGAPESVLERCTHIDDGSRVRPLTDEDRATVLEAHTRKASLALRNLAIASRAIDSADTTGGSAAVEKGLTYLGLVSIVDPIRESVPEAMRLVLAAGVKVNIVTGDFSLTAEAIARQAGLDGDDELVTITGAQLAEMSDADVLAHALCGGTIFSRVAPEDKVRIVDLVKSSGNVVAVTGDGINDAPALRHADIGVAMGATGTDVAKQAASIVLLDDSFATLVGAVRQGRTIYQNIRKGVLSCLTSNAAELVVNSVSLALASLFGVPLALNVLQILAIDLLGEILPIAALGRDREEGETMTAKPRDAKARILNRRSILDILWCGVVIGGLSIANYLWLYSRNGVDPFTETVPAALLAQAMTISYVTIMVCQLVSIVQRRSVHGFFTRYQFSNRVFWYAMLAAVLIMLTIVNVPLVSSFFGTAPLGFEDWALVVGAALVFLLIREGGRVLGAMVRGSRHEPSAQL